MKVEWNGIFVPPLSAVLLPNGRREQCDCALVLERPSPRVREDFTEIQLYVVHTVSGWWAGHSAAQPFAGPFAARAEAQEAALNDWKADAVNEVLEGA